MGLNQDQVDELNARLDTIERDLLKLLRSIRQIRLDVGLGKGVE